MGTQTAMPRDLRRVSRRGVPRNEADESSLRTPHPHGGCTRYCKDIGGKRLNGTGSGRHHTAEHRKVCWRPPRSHQRVVGHRPVLCIGHPLEDVC
jgi:hypothetical protein